MLIYFDYSFFSLSLFFLSSFIIASYSSSSFYLSSSFSGLYFFLIYHHPFLFSLFIVHSARFSFFFPRRSMTDSPHWFIISSLYRFFSYPTFIFYVVFLLLCSSLPFSPLFIPHYFLPRFFLSIGFPLSCSLFSFCYFFLLIFFCIIFSLSVSLLLFFPSLFEFGFVLSVFWWYVC